MVTHLSIPPQLYIDHLGGRTWGYSPVCCIPPQLYSDHLGGYSALYTISTWTSSYSALYTTSAVL
jgi:hypothetical protein